MRPVWGSYQLAAPCHECAGSNPHLLPAADDGEDVHSSSVGRQVLAGVARFMMLQVRGRPGAPEQGLVLMHAADPAAGLSSILPLLPDPLPRPSNPPGPFLTLCVSCQHDQPQCMPRACLVHCHSLQLSLMAQQPCTNTPPWAWLLLVVQVCTPLLRHHYETICSLVCLYTAVILLLLRKRLYVVWRPVLLGLVRLVPLTAAAWIACSYSHPDLLLRLDECFMFYVKRPGTTHQMAARLTHLDAWQLQQLLLALGICWQAVTLPVSGLLVCVVAVGMRDEAPGKVMCTVASPVAHTEWVNAPASRPVRP